ncbi:MAG: DUF2332 domain-containing protein [Thermaurantiacus sp.]
MSDREPRDRETLVRRSFLEQAALCEEFGSAFMGRLVRALEAVLDRDTETGRAVLDWGGPPEAKGDALALRLCGGLHALVLRRSDPLLGTVYPPNEIGSEVRFRETIAAAVRANDAELRTWLRQAPQTNEVGRSAVLYLGLLEIARRFDQPLRLHEIGSSAGLNLVLDRYAYRFGRAAFGEASATLLLAPEWTGPEPAPARVAIVERRGCDVSPVDPNDPDDRVRLHSYVWPDQAERHHRLAAAIAIAAQAAAPIDRMDAGIWVARNLSAERPAGRTTVLMHALTYCYLPPETRAAIAAHMAALGATANSERPLAWLAFELDDANQPELTLQCWPDGGRRLIARAHPHGRAIAYLAPDSALAAQ